MIVGGGVVLSSSYEARAFGVRTAMGGRQARQLCPRAIVVAPRMSAYSEASAAVFEVFEQTTPLVEGLSIDEAFLEVGGLRTGVGHAHRDRRAVAAQCPRTGRAPDHGRGRQDQVPCQSGERRGQARRSAGGAARRRARLSPSAPGSTALGRRARDRAQAPRARDHDRRRSRPARRSVARLDARHRVRSAPPRPRAQPRSSTGGGWPPPAFDRVTARARSQAPISRRHRRRARRARRPRHRPDARRRAGRPHRHAPLALRRLLARRDRTRSRVRRHRRSRSSTRCARCWPRRCR